MKADARSFVWKWFGSLNDATTGKRVHADKVFCSQCFDSNRLKGYKETVSTTNLAQHMREAHGILFMIIFPRTFCLSTFSDSYQFCDFTFDIRQNIMQTGYRRGYVFAGFGVL